MIIRKTDRELKIMRYAGKIVAWTHQELQRHIKPGITTAELDQIADRFIQSYDAVPSFKGYHGFTGSICTSVNEELVHGVPGDRVLKNGDIISIDIGAKIHGYHGDSAWTYPVGAMTAETEQLLDVTRNALYKGLAEAKPKDRLSNISHAIQTFVEKHGFSVVREYVGHGVGQDLHEDPQIPHFGPPGKGVRLKPGMVLAVEPMVNMGERYVHTLEDNWTVVTTDGKNCAHFEHTIAITDTGYEILTQA